MSRSWIIAALVLWMSGTAAMAQTGQPPTVGILALGNPDPSQFIADFKSKLQELGYVEGTSIRIEVRSAKGRVSQLPALARELAAKVDILVPYQTPAATAAKAATTKVPIVMASVADPVGSGLVRSLSHPGGNLTGVSGATSELVVKNLELLREVVPSVRRVAVLANEPDPFHKIMVRHIQSAAVQLKIDVKIILARAGDDFDSHFRDMIAWQADAALVQPSLPLSQVAESARKARLPAVSPNSNFIRAGGLLSYSPDLTVVHKMAAVVVDKVLQGRKPHELPVEITTRFRLTINLKVAAAIGLKISPYLLARADDVIE